MMNNDITVTQLSRIVLKNVASLFTLLDDIVNSISDVFKDVQVYFDKTDSTFAFHIGDKTIVKLITNINEFSIIIDVINIPNNAMIAECVMTIDGGYKESYSRFSDNDVKPLVQKWFNNLSNIYPELNESIENFDETT